jgi:hypothetical protein
MIFGLNPRLCYECILNENSFILYFIRTFINLTVILMSVIRNYANKNILNYHYLWQFKILQKIKFI